MGYVTADTVPDGTVLPDGLGPMPGEVADHVAAVVLFGKPSPTFLEVVDAPPISIGQRYRAKTIDLCNPGDPICQPGGDDNGAHARYAATGKVGEAAAFAAARL